VAQPEAVLFDFDGVLADTEPLHWAAWRMALSTKGIALPWEYYVTECVGMSDMEMLSKLGSSATPPRSIDELLPVYPLKTQMFCDSTKSLQVMDEAVIDAVKSLAVRRIGVVTSSARTEIRPILERHGLLDFLAAVVYGDEVSRLKPDPEPYRVALQRLGVSMAVVFEDSATGVASAQAAGCEVIQVPSPKDLPRLVRQRFGGSPALSPFT
jgi:beta-phosphoglucomutase